MLNRLSLYMPTRATVNPRYYCCLGRIHVKNGLLGIICIVAVLELLEVIVFVRGRYSITTPWQMFIEVLEAVCLFCLIIAYRTQRSLFLWPFMTSEFLVVLATSLVAAICFITFVFPNGAYHDIFTKHEDDSDGVIRVRALIAFVFYLWAAILEIWALTVTIACNRYFDDINEAKLVRNRRTNNPIINPARQNNVTRESVARRPEDVLPDSFANPNFRAGDSDGEENAEVFQGEGGSTRVIA